jgi:hypothetical protein
MDTRLKSRIGWRNGEKLKREKESVRMLRRVFAWVLLAGFILLILNIAVFHYFLEASIFVYLIIAIWFIFTNKPLPSRKKKSENTAEESVEGINGDTFEELTQADFDEYIKEAAEEANEKNNKE